MVKDWKSSVYFYVGSFETKARKEKLFWREELQQEQLEVGKYYFW
jgi:hypothetical protein